MKNGNEKKRNRPSVDAGVSCRCASIPISVIRRSHCGSAWSLVRRGEQWRSQQFFLDETIVLHAMSICNLLILLYSPR